MLNRPRCVFVLMWQVRWYCSVHMFSCFFPPGFEWGNTGNCQNWSRLGPTLPIMLWANNWTRKVTDYVSTLIFYIKYCFSAHISLLSHSAVVARELGLPTVVGVSGGLMKRLKVGNSWKFWSVILSVTKYCSFTITIHVFFPDWNESAFGC